MSIRPTPDLEEEPITAHTQRSSAMRPSLRARRPVVNLVAVAAAVAMSFCAVAPTATAAPSDDPPAKHLGTKQTGGPTDTRGARLRVTIPSKASHGVTLVQDAGPTIKIGLPHASGTGQRTLSTKTSTSSYRTNRGFTNVVKQVEGGVQMLVVIGSANAPQRYSFAVSGPAGSKVRVNADGTADLVDRRGFRLLSAAEPWAHDATGKKVPTRYVAGPDGRSLVQIVDHHRGRLAYPITADPVWLNKTWAFVQCIFGVGVPIGVAWAMVADPALWAYFLRIGPLPASAGRWGYQYVNWLRNVCGYALR